MAIIKLPECLSIRDQSCVYKMMILKKNILEEQSVEIDFSDLKWIDPFGAVLLGVFICNLLEKEVKVTISNVKDDVCEYLIRMDFFKEFGLDFDYPYTRWPSGGRFREFEILQSPSRVEEVVGDIVNILRNNIKDEEMIKYINHSLEELLDNVFNHSKALRGAIIMAQSYSSKGEVIAAIGDDGRGFYRSLKKALEQKGINIDNSFWPHCTAIEKGTEKGITGVDVECIENNEYASSLAFNNNVGAGLYELRRFSEINHWIMRIVSHNGDVSFGATSYSEEYELLPIYGTVVGIKFRPRPLKSFEELMSIIRSEFRENGMQVSESSVNVEFED